MSHVTHMNESCHTYEWVMSHIWMSHVTHMNESCHIYEWVMSQHNSCIFCPHFHPWLVHICDLTHLLFGNVLWRRTLHSHVWHNSFKFATWLIGIFAILWHLSFAFTAFLIQTCVHIYIPIYTYPPYVHICIYRYFYISSWAACTLITGHFSEVCVCVCVCVCMCVYMNTHQNHTNVCTQVFLYEKLVDVYANQTAFPICVCVCACVHVGIHKHTRDSTNMCTQVFLYEKLVKVYANQTAFPICVCVCACGYT